VAVRLRIVDRLRMEVLRPTEGRRPTVEVLRPIVARRLLTVAGHLLIVEPHLRTVVEVIAVEALLPIMLAVAAQPRLVMAAVVEAITVEAAAVVDTLLPVAAMVAIAKQF